MMKCSAVAAGTISGVAEVHQLDASLGCNHDVLRLDVTMDALASS